MSNTRWSPFFKQLVIVATLVATIWLLFQTRVIFAPLVLTLLLAYMVTLLSNRVRRFSGWARSPSVLLAQVVVILLVLVFPALILPWLVNALTTFGNTFLNVVQELLQVEPRPLVLTPSLALDLGPFYRPINQWLASLIGPDLSAIQKLQTLLPTFASGAASVVRGAVSGVLYAFLIVVVSFYVARDAPLLGRYFNSRLPENYRPEISRLWRDLKGIWNAFIQGQLVLGLMVGTIVWLAMAILGNRSAAALGLISGAMEFVPAIGPVVAAIPGILIALFLGSSWLPLPNIWFAIIVAAVYMLVQQVENLYLLPKVVGSRVRLHPAVVIVGALVGAQLGGVLGILLAAPTIATLRLIGGYSYRKLFDLEPFPEEEIPVDPATLWRTRVQEQPVLAILFDLDGTLIESDDHAVDELIRRLRFLDGLVDARSRAWLARRVVLLVESIFSELISVIDLVHLDRPLSRLNDRLRNLAGSGRLDRYIPVPGSIEMLHSLRQRHYALGIVTNRGRADTIAYLRQFGLENVFDVVVSADDVRRMKPHSMPVRRAAKCLGVPLELCVMVGDTGSDVRAAQAAGALAVGVLTGFGENGDLRQADLVLPSTAQLGAWL